MRKLMVFLAVLAVSGMLTSCTTAIMDLTRETTMWEMGVSRNFLGGGSSAESNIKHEDTVSENKVISPDNKKKKFVVGNSTK